MSSVAQSDKLAARVAVKVPQPDSLVEVRLTPPESNFEIKVSPGEDVIELRISPGSSLVEVRISPPGRRAALDDPGGEAAAPATGEQPEEEVVTGVSRSEFAAMVADEEAAEAKKLLSDLADQNLTPEIAEPEETEPEAAEPEEPEPEEPEPEEPEPEETEPEEPEPEEPELAEPEDKKKNSSLGLIGQAAREALDRLSAAVQEEQAAVQAALTAPKPEANPLSTADATVMVEIYEDVEPSTAADTVTPLPDDELMDISPMEQDDDLAIENIDVAGLSDIDLDKSRLPADQPDSQSAIKAKPMTQVRPGHTVVPE